jgi:uncharacterized RDD family membrane protein YckC
MGDWWYSVQGVKKGPVSIDVLRSQVHSGQINSQTLVWQQGMEQWTALQHVTEVSDILKAIPPDLPKPSPEATTLTYPLAGKWRRFLARLIDIWIELLGLAWAVGYVGARIEPAFGLWLQRPESGLIYAVALGPFAMLLDALLIVIFGNSIGKAIFGIKVSTTGGAKLSLTDHVNRSIGCWWYGLGALIPIVSLFTMAIQGRKVDAGKFTSYDADKFFVRAKPLGVLRRISAGIAFVGLFGIVAVLNGLSKEQDRRLLVGQNWTNPDTGKLVQLPAGWIVEPLLADGGEKLQSFTSPTLSMIVIVGVEIVGSEYSMIDYLNAYMKANSKAFVLDKFGAPVGNAGEMSWTATGVASQPAGKRIHVEILQRGNQYWRLITTSFGEAGPSNPEHAALREKLVASFR